MRKLNRKGFTLVELLAVIVILAIVVGISFPIISNIINNSKNNSLEVAVKEASKYLTDQYALVSVDYDTASAEFKNVFWGKTSANGEISLTPALVKEVGFNNNTDTDESKTEVIAKIDDATGRICVTVKHIPVTSEYYSTDHWTTSGNPKDSAKNSNCE